ncbi:MAG TPA: hypothetical protein VNH40_05710, partial [Gaiellaceae bacterium]|nr:hypothetical protein [Gaiellaceae bacterium]
VGLALAGSERTRRRLARAGVEVVVYEGEEISRKGLGGPTCLTLPLPLEAPPAPNVDSGTPSSSSGA